MAASHNCSRLDLVSGAYDARSLRAPAAQGALPLSVGKLQQAEQTPSPETMQGVAIGGRSICSERGEMVFCDGTTFTT